MSSNRGMATSPILPPSSVTGGVLIASPSMVLREQVLNSFGDSGRAVHEASGGAEALVKLEKGDWQLLYLDRRLPDLDSEELIGVIKRRFPGIEMVVLDSDTGQDLPMLRDRDLCSTQIPTRLEMAWGAPSSVWEDQSPAEPLVGMIGQAASMQRLYRMVRLAAPRNITVLVLGATGTGKELVANALHKLSPRAARPFVVVNCAAIPEALLESELFGHVRGAFTGAVQSHLGRIQAASGGTLFLDEVGEMPAGLQAKLLRFLEQKEIQRLGSTDTQKIDVRVIAATNQDLFDRVEQGSFREDLYYRLSAFPIELPPLVERLSDVAALAEHFLTNTDTTGNSRRDVQMSEAALHLLETHDWPGNVRELQHVVERAAILAEAAGVIGPEHLYFPAARNSRKTQKGWAQGALA
jgi:DNA-binding NtrC family response regulator